MNFSCIQSIKANMCDSHLYHHDIIHFWILVFIEATILMLRCHGCQRVEVV